jgi:hypothetical protein
MAATITQKQIPIIENHNVDSEDELPEYDETELLAKSKTKVT